MEAVPRLPMISFELKVSPESVQFGPQLKQYIASFYNEDPESYNTEISNLEALRAAAVRPATDVSGCQLLKKYYCQLHFLKSRFPMEEMQAAAVHFTWKDAYSNMSCTVLDIRFEMMCILYNIGALHTKLGALDCRTSPDGLKMACTHFQCAAWAFQTVKETYHQMVPYMSSIEVVHFMQQVCFAQAQECILEKSMMDNRKATITAKVAVQVVDHYKRALALISSGDDDSSFSSLAGSRTVKEWSKYLSFKVSYHKCIALLFQGQQAEEQQKMGERVAFYQAACEQLEEARKLSSSLKHQKEVNEAIAFTSDVVEGKRKAAKNENEFIYHEEVPDKHALQEVKGASLVKGIAFNVNDVEVSGPDIFAKLVPMEAHEASSLYSEKKAQKLRQLGELVESKDQALAEFMSSLQLDVFNQMRQATGLSQDLVDRAAALSAKPMATQELVNAMGKLSNSYHEVESMLNEIQELLKEEEQNEKEYQELMGKRPPSMVATDLAREAAKYREAHNKANDSNQNLHKAMTTHVANLKILAQPLVELQRQIPSVELPDPNVDESCVKEIESLIAKVEEMRNQRAMLWTQFREAVHKDDITGVLVTRQPDQPLDELFQRELQKHQELANLIEQNAAAQENILKAFVDAYARSTSTRRYLQDVINKRNATVTALITSYDTYEDLLAKANKGIDFYSKLETNVSKLLQRIKSASKVQQEEREQMLLKNSAVTTTTATTTTNQQAAVASSAPKLRDYLDTRKKTPRTYAEATPPPPYYGVLPEAQVWPPAVRPAPLGSEVTGDPVHGKLQEQDPKTSSSYPANVAAYPAASFDQQQRYDAGLDQNLANRLSSLRTGEAKPGTYYSQYSSYTPNNYSDGYSVPYTYPTPAPSQPSSAQANAAAITANKQAFTVTTDTYQPIPSVGQNPPGSDPTPDTNVYSQLQYPNYSVNYNTPSSTSMGTYTQVSQPSQVSQPTMYYPTETQISQPSVYYPSDTQIAQPAQTGVYYPAEGQVSQPGAYYALESQVGQPAQVGQPTQVTQPNVYYPTGYGPGSGQQLPNEQTYSYSASFAAAAEYATSVHPGMSNVGYNSTYSAPTLDLKSSNSNVNNYVISNGYQAYDASQQYPGDAYYYNYPTQSQAYAYGYGYVMPPQESSASTTVAANTTTSTVSVTTKESNIDLLTGLDFTVNQAPLIPQQEASKSVRKAAEVSKVGTKVTETPPIAPQPPKIEKVINRKPLNNAEVKRLFEQEVDKFEKFVDVLTNKTLSGPTNLDLKWKEIVDKQEAEKKAISVARCYPMKNRYPDILPYDYSRVELKGAKDDYINASYIKDISYYAAPFIVTQSPLQSTIGDFWTMIKEQQVELILCLQSDSEVGGDIYWPTEKGKDLTIEGMVVSLTNVTVRPHWIERLISISIPEKRDSRIVMQLQLTSWPGSLFPSSPEGFVAFVTEAIGVFLQQRSTAHPVVVHCSSGIGRSGLACLLITAILEVTSNPTSVPDLVSLTVKLAAWRKNILRDREHLKFAYEAFLAYMKQVVAQGQARKVLNDVVQSGRSEMMVTATEKKQEPDDPLNSLDPFWASKKH